MLGKIEYVIESYVIKINSVIDFLLDFEKLETKQLDSSFPQRQKSLFSCYMVCHFSSFMQRYNKDVWLKHN